MMNTRVRGCVGLAPVVGLSCSTLGGTARRLGTIERALTVAILSVDVVARLPNDTRLGIRVRPPGRTRGEGWWRAGIAGKPVAATGLPVSLPCDGAHTRLRSRGMFRRVRRCRAAHRSWIRQLTACIRWLLRMNTRHCAHGDPQLSGEGAAHPVEPPLSALAALRILAMAVPSLGFAPCRHAR